MSDKVISSIAFVINVCYTYTFANAVAFTLSGDKVPRFSIKPVDLTLASILCGTIALIMTLRYFFGNNIFIHQVFSDAEKTKYVRFFHFIVVLLQSLVLLIASFEIRDPRVFFTLLGVLFLIEFLWYVISAKIDRGEVIFTDSKETREFLYTQLYGLAVLLCIAYAVLFENMDEPTWIIIITVLFAIDTGWDLRKNMGKYMDVKQ